MPYCGHFGCGCCSRECDKCGRMQWHEDLQNGVCSQCRLEEAQEEIERLRANEEEELVEVESLKGRVLDLEGKDTT